MVEMNVSRGQSLVETVLVVAIVLVALGAFVARSLGAGAGSAPAAVDALPAFVESARAVAATTGDGATVTMTQLPLTGSGRASFMVALYRYRPNPGSQFDGSAPLTTERFSGGFRASLGPGPLALFIASAGTVSFAQWTPGSGTLALEPACAAPLELVVAGDDLTAQNAPASPPPNAARNGIAWFTMDCLEARLVAQ